MHAHVFKRHDPGILPVQFLLQIDARVSFDKSLCERPEMMRDSRHNNRVGQTKPGIYPYNCYLGPLSFIFLLCKMDIIPGTIWYTIYRDIKIMNYYCNPLFYYNSVFTFLVSHGSVVWRRVLSFRWGEAWKGWQQLNLRTEWIAWLSGIPLQIVHSFPKLLICPERQRAHACPPWHLHSVSLFCASGLCRNGRPSSQPSWHKVWYSLMNIKEPDKDALPIGRKELKAIFPYHWSSSQEPL